MVSRFALLALLPPYPLGVSAAQSPPTSSDEAQRLHRLIILIALIVSSPHSLIFPKSARACNLQQRRLLPNALPLPPSLPPSYPKSQPIVHSPPPPLSHNLLQRLLYRLRRINKVLQHLIQTRQILLPPLIIRNQPLLLPQQTQPLLLQRLALRMLVLDARYRQRRGVRARMLGEQG